MYTTTTLFSVMTGKQRPVRRLFSNPQLIFWGLQLACFAVLLGRGWQHLAESPPYREFLWNEQLLRGIVEGWFGTDWGAYVTNPRVDATITVIEKVVGIFLLLSAAVVAAMRLLPKSLLRVILWLDSLYLILLAALYFIGKGYFIGQFLEYSLQFLSPLFLLFAWQNRRQISPRLLFVLKIATAITFTAHGLYALGYYPRPGYFTAMTMKGFGFSEAGAVTFLYWVGVLDIVFAVLLFVPLRRVQYVALTYIIVWGFLTTMARVYANFYPDFWLQSILQWLPHTLYRMPHFLIPIVILGWLFQKRSKVST